MTEREEFEIAYREIFPMIASLVSDVFALDDAGDYGRANVYCSYKLWQAARADVAGLRADREGNAAPTESSALFSALKTISTMEAELTALRAERDARVEVMSANYWRGL